MILCVVSIIVFIVSLSSPINVNAIFGGNDTDPTDYLLNYRYVAEIIGENDRTCMGVLITNQLVLTSAYCVTPDQPKGVPFNPESPAVPLHSLKVLFHRDKNTLEESVSFEGLGEFNVSIEK